MSLQLSILTGDQFHLDLANKLPSNILFGTSSWNYSGWKGLIYNSHYSSEKNFRETALIEYSRFPWFRTVGIDHSFYTPPKAETLERYAEQTPESFRWVSKVWEEVTIPRFANHPRYGLKAGTTNENFLNASFFQDRVLSLYLDSNEVLKKTGPFVFQFQQMRQKNPRDFLEKLDSFLEALPQQFDYAIEIRDKELLTAEYFDILNRNNCTHCFNHWTHMPSLRTQMRKAHEAGGLKKNTFVARILTPLGLPYQQAVEKFKPYTTIREANHEMRKDVVALCKRAVNRNAKAFIIVNNRSEGNSPLTIDAIGKQFMEYQESLND